MSRVHCLFNLVALCLKPFLLSVLFYLLPMAHGLLDLVAGGKAVLVVIRCPKELSIVCRTLKLFLYCINILIEVCNQVFSVHLLMLQVPLKPLQVLWISPRLAITSLKIGSAEHLLLFLESIWIYFFLLSPYLEFVLWTIVLLFFLVPDHWE